MRENFVTWEKYQQICRELGEKDEQAQRDLAGFLHILGIALNYRDDPRLCDTHVLNPRWVTEGIYPLLRAPQVCERQGVLEAADLGAVLDAKDYPASKHDFLLRLMERFQLCFRLSGNKERYLVPELLGENQPDIKSLLEAPGLGFRYQYEVLPEGVLPRFIVQTHIYSKPDPHEAHAQRRWRTGVVLEWNDCQAVVRADYRERRVDIHVTGPEARRRELLAVVREKFEEQHRDLKGLEVDERVPVPGEPGVTVSYRDLLQREEDGEEGYRPEGARRKVRVVDMLNGVETRLSRARRRDPERRFSQKIEHHHHYPPGASPEFTGVDMEEVHGDKNVQDNRGATFSNSPAAIKQMLQNSYNTVQQMPTSELKVELERLAGLVEQFIVSAPPEPAEIASDRFEALTKEAAKPKPDKEWLKLSAKGLGEAAQAVASMSGPIITVLDKIKGYLGF